MRWHKKSRGAPGAIARNRVPEVHALPADLPSTPWPSRYKHSAPEVLPPPDSADNREPATFLHLVDYSEGNEFQAPIVQYWTALRSRLPEPSTLRMPHRNVPPLTLAGMGDWLQLEFLWSDVPGRPRRYHRHMREQVLLAKGQWMQVRFNARHTYLYDGTWYYEKHMFNIGFADALVPTLLVDTPPDYLISDLADLH